jgi:hypothetical protein
MSEFFAYFLATSSIDPAAQIAQLQDLFVPVLQKAVSFSMKVCLGITSANAFYILVIKFLRI